MQHLWRMPRQVRVLSHVRNIHSKRQGGQGRTCGLHQLLGGGRSGGGGAVALVHGQRHGGVRQKVRVRPPGRRPQRCLH